MSGSLFVVATPIGDPADLSLRARRVLAEVKWIAAEDTRRAQRQLVTWGIHSPRLFSLYEHNETERIDQVVTLLGEGQSGALISDAGTPLINDPGYRLVRAVQDQGLKVVPVPGASSITAALSVAGLATDRFCFEGFLPSRRSQRQTRLESLKNEPRTLVFLETSHRILESLEDCCSIYGTTREAAIAKELTKTYEQVVRKPLGVLYEWLKSDATRSLGEFVLLIGGAEEAAGESNVAKAEPLLKALLRDTPLKNAVTLVADLTGLPRNGLYRLALRITQGAE